MSEVKRYGSAVFDSGLIEMACGDYVTYSDYQKLVAENAALRRIALSYHILTVPEREAPTEPEIDAAIAEIKAHGVDEFAEYIVSSNRTVQNLYCEMQAISYAHDMRKRATDKEIMEVIDSMGGSGNKAARRAANLRAGRKG